MSALHPQTHPLAYHNACRGTSLTINRGGGVPMSEVPLYRETPESGTRVAGARGRGGTRGKGDEPFPILAQSQSAGVPRPRETPIPIESTQVPKHRDTVGSYGGSVSYERGTRVAGARGRGGTGQSGKGEGRCREHRKGRCRDSRTEHSRGAHGLAHPRAYRGS